MSNKFETDTKYLIDAFFKEYFNSQESNDIILKTIKKEVNILFDKHRLVYSNMIIDISITTEIDILVKKTAESIFSDGLVNWGRIISLITFGILIVEYLKTINNTDKITSVSTIISSYLIEHQKHWLIKNNAWIGLVDFFTVQTYTSPVKSLLTFFIVFMGTGAMLYSAFNLTY
ncbi:induced myeloid leukemia cell differentiation protein Mcl-1-like [Lymphocystis disease virus 2]|uniref:Induced myeloid leukemia cell differentiation protein Mcl-1-like n=1 Tax=Lymphocystis disease virus 2 TaxID=159183 RepID=A0A6F8X2N8_9VIRU|nr:induced myeloid leukemia cell differentiation protein Mcl-1-like [Lymphocystis disease virus 2]